MTDISRRDPLSEISVEAAIARYLKSRIEDSTELSRRAWGYRLDQFRKFCDLIDVEKINNVQRADIGQFRDWRAEDVSVVTLEGNLWTLKKWIEYCAAEGAVDDGMVDTVAEHIPDLDPEQRRSDEYLEADRALAVIKAYRKSDAHRATRKHVILEIAWFTAARRGGMRALDRQDFHADEGYLLFRHRSDTGTPIKNRYEGERAVSLPPETASVIHEYLQRYHVEEPDEHHRLPLISSEHGGRPALSTFTGMMYQALEPCHIRDCPHKKDPETCKFLQINHSSKCPSSISPHPVRTGSIKWHLDSEVPIYTVAGRVNATPRTIKMHYDPATAIEEMQRRRSVVENAIFGVDQL